jgi:hypothetical protein
MVSLPRRQAVTGPAGVVDVFGEAALDDFCRQFEVSGLYSIDAFLARRPRLQEIGKRCIAALLLAAESQWRVENPATDWYGTFWNQVTTDSLDDLDFSWLSVVTFNYDRSFEQYLLAAIMATYGAAEQDALESLGTLRIVHVYGSLGGAFSTSNGYLEREGGLTAARVGTAAQSLRVIPEHRNAGGDDFEVAKELLRASWRTAVMGFGFDPTNLARLDAGDTLANQRMRRENHSGSRKVVATCIGMTSAEACEAGATCGIEAQSSLGKVLPKGFIETDCVGLLRETLILKS